MIGAMASGPRRHSAIALGAVAILAVMAAAVGFARSDQSLRVADDATVVQDAERGRAAIATYRANLTISVVAAASESSASSRRALEAAGRALDRVEESTMSLDHDPLGPLTADLFSSHQAVSLAIDAGDVVSADELVSSETLPLLDELQGELAEASAAASARITAEQTSAGRTARLSSFVVALIAPMLALWAYRRAAQRRLERERLAAELQRQKDLTEAQQSLISGLSHQLRTPLTGIYGFAEALVADSVAGTPDPEFVKEAGTTILGEANRLRAMVDDILVTARSQAGDLAFDNVPFSLGKEIAAAVEPFSATGTAIDVRCEDIDLIGDRLRVRHVLRNLIDNAVRHGRPTVRIEGETNDTGYTLTVIDHGDGPPQQDDSPTFAHSGDDALVTGSLGLGLSVCRSLCEGMGVDLSQERKDGSTRFVLRFTQPTPARETVAPITAPR